MKSIFFLFLAMLAPVTGFAQARDTVPVCVIDTAANAGPGWIVLINYYYTLSVGDQLISSILVDKGDDDGAAAADARLTAVAQQMIDKNVCRILVDNTK